MSLFNLPGKVYLKRLEKRYYEIIELKLDDTQSGFRPGRITTGQIFTLQPNFLKILEYATDVYTCFANLKNDLVLREKF